MLRSYTKIRSTRSVGVAGFPTGACFSSMKVYRLCAKSLRIKVTFTPKSNFEDLLNATTQWDPESAWKPVAERSAHHLHHSQAFSLFQPSRHQRTFGKTGGRNGVLLRTIARRLDQGNMSPSSTRCCKSSKSIPPFFPSQDFRV